MGIARTYRIMLRLYPADYRVRFAQEMQTSFSRTSEEYSRRAKTAFVWFILEEFGSLVNGARAEWMAKMATDRSVRGRHLPDLRFMRPPGVPRNLWFAGTRVADAVEANAIARSGR